MIELRDIKDAVSLKLSSEFKEYEIYDEEIRQGFDPPAFFIQVIPISTVRSNMFTKNPSLTVDIHFFPKTECNDDLYDMENKLEQSFVNGIKVKDRYIDILKTECQIVDFVLHFQISLDYLVSIRDQINKDTQNYELMKEVQFNKEVIK
ncbi:DUF6838 family protein [Clostridium sp. AWRP]|uniref:phage tail terminator family protein n=1 Tax=Clostridium sp. AWRP TaxID=2212991 RepID=UPI000FD85005|nr:hypothetical protein [Clostridium sp. AWRP]AZV57927.1 hypothetical protein DMR38_15670 [Clostridium sp. AWRP]